MLHDLEQYGAKLEKLVSYLEDASLLLADVERAIKAQKHLTVFSNCLNRLIDEAHVSIDKPQPTTPCGPKRKHQYDYTGEVGIIGPLPEKASKRKQSHGVH